MRSAKHKVPKTKGILSLLYNINCLEKVYLLTSSSSQITHYSTMQGNCVPQIFRLCLCFSKEFHALFWGQVSLIFFPLKIIPKWNSFRKSQPKHYNMVIRHLSISQQQCPKHHLKTSRSTTNGSLTSQETKLT